VVLHSGATGPRTIRFPQPVFGWLNGKRVLYSATGDGAVVLRECPHWASPSGRVPLTKAGINSAPAHS